MNKIMRALVISLPIIAIFTYFLIPTNPQKELLTLIRRAVQNDKSINSSEFTAIKKLIRENKRSFSEKRSTLFDENGNVNEQEVENYLHELYPGQSFIIEQTGISGRINFFIDNSMSMDGYVNGSSGFKASLSYLLAQFAYHYNIENVNFSLVNDKIYPYEVEQKNDIETMINNLTPNSKSWNVGGQGRYSTKLNDLFRMVLDQTAKNDITFFITDCIYSLDKGLNTYGRLKIQQNLTMNSILTKLRNQNDLSILIMQFESSFNGTYYTYSNQRSQINGNRPYYILAIGSHYKLSMLTKNIDFSKVDGFKNWYTYSNLGNNEIFYSILEKSNVIGQFRADHQNSNSNYIHGIENIKAYNKCVKFMVAANFGAMIDEDSFILDTSNYETSNGFHLCKIEKIKKELIDQNDLRMVSAGNPTHVLTVESSNYTPQKKVSICLKNKLPLWAIRTNSDDDTKINSQLTQTFGLKYFLSGIHNAYTTHNYTDNVCSFQISLN